MVWGDRQLKMGDIEEMVGIKLNKNSAVEIFQRQIFASILNNRWNMGPPFHTWEQSKQWTKNRKPSPKKEKIIPSAVGNGRQILCEFVTTFER